MNPSLEQEIRSPPTPDGSSEQSSEESRRSLSSATEPTQNADSAKTLPLDEAAAVSSIKLLAYAVSHGKSSWSKS